MPCVHSSKASILTIIRIAYRCAMPSPPLALPASRLTHNSTPPPRPHHEHLTPARYRRRAEYRERLGVRLDGGVAAHAVGDVLELPGVSRIGRPQAGRDG